MCFFLHPLWIPPPSIVSLLSFISRIPDTFGQMDKVTVTFDSIPEVFGQCRGVLHAHNGFKTKEEVVVAQQTWGGFTVRELPPFGPCCKRALDVHKGVC